MKLTRRGFFGTITAAYLARFAPTPIIALPNDGLNAVVLSAPESGTVGGISRATFSFWRNQQVSCHSTDEWMKRADAVSNSRMADAFNQCERTA